MRLHEQVNQLKKEKEIFINGINEIRRYLNSEKFSIDTYVNKQDIISRFNNIFDDINNVN